jgi:hypothetical protein
LFRSSSPSVDSLERLKVVGRSARSSSWAEMALPGGLNIHFPRPIRRMPWTALRGQVHWLAASIVSPFSSPSRRCGLNFDALRNYVKMLHRRRLLFRRRKETLPQRTTLAISPSPRDKNQAIVIVSLARRPPWTANTALAASRSPQICHSGVPMLTTGTKALA